MTETAPVSDTASSGLNGRLQRVAQNLTSILTKLNASIAVTGTFWQATQPVSGTFWQATQPVSAAALPLPTGAATEATLAAASAKLPASLGGKTAAGSLSVAQATDDVFAADLTANTYVIDVASAALTASANTAAVTPGAGTVSQEFVISVTAVSGTTPTLDVIVQESSDDGTNWFDIYHFPRITANGHFRSPAILQQGTRTRFVQTVGGTTPSFTRSLGRVRSHKNTTYQRSFIDRAVAPNTLNSTTAAFDVEGCSRIQLMIRMGAITTTAPAFKLQGSNDNSNWYDIGTAMTAVANAIVTIQADAILPSYVRAIVSTAGVGATLGELWFKASRS